MRPDPSAKPMQKAQRGCPSEGLDLPKFRRISVIPQQIEKVCPALGTRKSETDSLPEGTEALCGFGVCGSVLRKRYGDEYLP